MGRGSPVSLFLARHFHRSGVEVAKFFFKEIFENCLLLFLSLAFRGGFSYICKLNIFSPLIGLEIQIFHFQLFEFGLYFLFLQLKLFQHFFKVSGPVRCSRAATRLSCLPSKELHLWFNFYRSGVAFSLQSSSFFVLSSKAAKESLMFFVDFSMPFNLLRISSSFWLQSPVLSRAVIIASLDNSCSLSSLVDRIWSFGFFWIR